MTCVAEYEMKLPIYENFMEKNNCICINGRLENGVMNLYLIFSIYCDKGLHYVHTYTNHEINRPLLHIQVIGNDHRVTTMDENVN